jgi:hypothetical protein
LTLPINDPKRPAGAPPWQSLRSANKELLESLYYAFTQFKNRGGDSGREGVRLACQAVARFIAVRHENPELAAPLLAISQALTDFDRGVQTELLATEPLKRSRSRQKAHLKRMASVCLEVLIKEGDNPAVAADRVARAVAKWPNIGVQPITPTTIKNWREAEHRHRARAPGGHFDRICDHFRSLNNPKGEIERLLREGPPDAPNS